MLAAMSLRRLRTGVCLASLALACGGARPAAPSPAGARAIEVQGHRGARALFPEDTLPAFEHALAIGVDTLELDLVVTKDEQLVIKHDLTINKTLCLGPGGAKLQTEPAVRTLTLKEVKEYDCGTLKNPDFPKQTPVPGTTIPTLDELFAWVERSPHPSAKRVGFNIETKSLPAHPELTPSPEAFVENILKVVNAHGMLARVTLQSFDHRSLVAAKASDPRVKTSALIEGTLPDLASMAAASRADIVSPELDWVTAAGVRALHQKGIRVVPWTANHTAEWDYLVGIGVDGIISDDPDALIAYLEQRGLR
jgi:glycerophosphoryl diester phosphodiesterase